jgi:serine/threonine-protein kinase SRPK3
MSITKLIYTNVDLKPTNILVSLGNGVGDNMDETLKAFLQEHPSESYEPRIEPSVSSDPIITVKSQPLPNFGLHEDLSNIRIKVIDFGSGK